MRKRLIAAEAIGAGEALTCLDVVPGPDGGYDFRIGVLRVGDRDYYPGPLGFAGRAVAPGEVIREQEGPGAIPDLVVRPNVEPWTARPTLTSLADILALLEEFRGSSS